MVSRKDIHSGDLSTSLITQEEVKAQGNETDDAVGNDVDKNINSGGFLPLGVFVGYPMEFAAVLGIAHVDFHFAD